MSYTGEIVAAPIEAAVVVAGAAVLATAAVIQGVGAVATAGARAAHAAAQSIAVDKINSDLRSTITKANDLNQQLEADMENAAQECYDDYAKTIQELEAAYQREPDMGAFLAGCQQAQKELRSEMQQKRSALETEAIAAIRNEMQTGQAIMNRQRRETEASIQRIQDDMERKRKAGELAEATLAEVRTMADAFRTAYGQSTLGQNALAACEEAMHKAEYSLAEEQYEAALTSACAVRDTLTLRVTDMLEAECRNRQLYADAVAALETAQKLMEQQRSIDYTFQDTQNGTPVNKSISDFSRYFRGAWETLETRLTNCQKQLSAPDFRDYAPEELQDRLNDLTDWQECFLQESALAYERLHNELLRMETGRMLIGRYRSLGYQMLPLTAEDKAVSSLDSLIVRLEKADTGERLYLRLNGVPDADGHISMHIDIEDHTEYDGSDDDIEQARMQERLANCSLIQNSNIGKNLRMKQRCTNPGVLDTYQKP